MGYLEASETNLDLFRKALEASWSEKTCWPGDWDGENPSKGQCRASSVVMQQIFGGDILMTWVNTSTSHYWNWIGKKEIDFTRQQFPIGTIIPLGKVVSVKEAKSGDVMEKTIPVLLEAVLSFVNESTK